jgi:hypothetical protein
MTDKELLETIVEICDSNVGCGSCLFYFPEGCSVHAMSFSYDKEYRINRILNICRKYKEDIQNDRTLRNDLQ